MSPVYASHLAKSDATNPNAAVDHGRAARMLSYFRYVRHADVPAFAARGWVVCGDLGAVHGHWSVLMVWSGEGEPA